MVLALNGRLVAAGDRLRSARRSLDALKTSHEALGSPPGARARVRL